MANTIQIGVSTASSINGVYQTWPTGNNAITMAGNYVSSGYISVPTSDTVLPLQSVGTPAYVQIWNQDATNYVDLGADGTNYGNRFQPGVNLLVPFNGAAVHVKAHTSACKIFFAIFEA